MVQIEHLISERKSLKNSLIYKGEVYTYFDEGLTRMVYVSPCGKKVIKICKDADEYQRFNIEEKEIYDRSSEKHLMAHTELDGSVIIQEFCLPVKFSNKALSGKQILFAMRCRDEVGFNSKGDLVCFDLDEFMKY